MNSVLRLRLLFTSTIARTDCDSTTAVLPARSSVGKSIVSTMIRSS